MDEAWRFIQHPTLRAYVQEVSQDVAAAQRRHAQTVDDFASADPLRTIVESCLEVQFLPRPSYRAEREES
jgi:hypothetical protein